MGRVVGPRKAPQPLADVLSSRREVIVTLIYVLQSISNASVCE